MKRIMVCMVFGAFLALGTNAATYYLKSDGTASQPGTTSFKNAVFWLDAEGKPSGEDGSALDPKADYVMTSTLRQGNANNTYSVFGGASLRVGTADSSASVCMLQYYDP